MEKEKVVGEITGETTPMQPITDVTKADKSLVLSYSFNYEGNAVDAVVRLTPAAEGKMNAQISFASGAYIMSGNPTPKRTASRENRVAAWLLLPPDLPCRSCPRAAR